VFHETLFSTTFLLGLNYKKQTSLQHRSFPETHNLSSRTANTLLQYVHTRFLHFTMRHFFRHIYIIYYLQGNTFNVFDITHLVMLAMFFFDSSLCKLKVHLCRNSFCKQGGVVGVSFVARNCWC